MKKILLALTVMIAALSSVRAVSIFSDNFDYPDGSLIANSGGAWLNNSGTTGTLVVSNAMLQLSGVAARSEDGAHLFSQSFTQSSFPTNNPAINLYASFSLMLTNLPSNVGTYIAHFIGTNTFGSLTGHRCRFYVCTSNLLNLQAPAGQYFVAVANSNAGTNNNAPWATGLITNTTYTIVMRYNTASGISTLWVNPTTESSTSVTASDTIPPGPDLNPVTGIATNGLISISAFGCREATGEGFSFLDTLKLGTAFVDVAGTNTAPSITGINTQGIPENGVAGPLSFTVGDSESPATSLIVSNATSNPTLIPSANIVFSGTGASRTVTLTPIPGQQGTAIITLYVSDGVNVSFTSFLLRVGFPSISTPASVITYSNLPPATTTVTVGDAESGPASVTVTNTFTNPTLISGVTVTGSGASRTVTISTITDQTGVSTITLYAVDPSGNVVPTSFVVSVSPKFGIVFSDDFSYNDWTLTDPQALEGATGSPWQDASGVHNQLQVTNGVAVITSSNTEDVAVGLLDSPYDTTNGVVVYTSFTINAQSFATQLGDYFEHLRDTISGSTFRAKVFIARTNAVGAGAYRVGIANGANNPSVIYPMDLATNTAYSIVTRYNTATAESVLWVNPVDETSPSVAATDVTTPNSIGAVGLRESDFEGTLWLDNLKVGTQFSDVAPPSLLSFLQIQLIGGNVQVSWNNSGLFFLQSATNILGPFGYTTNAGAPATTPYTQSATGRATFFRTINVAP